MESSSRKNRAENLPIFARHRKKCGITYKGKLRAGPAGHPPEGPPTSPMGKRAGELRLASREKMAERTQFSQASGFDMGALPLKPLRTLMAIRDRQAKRALGMAIAWPSSGVPTALNPAHLLHEVRMRVTKFE